MGDLVRVRINGVEKNVGRGFAAKHDLEVIEEPTHANGGQARKTTRKGGRPLKPKTTVAAAAAAKDPASAPAADNA